MKTSIGPAARLVLLTALIAWLVLALLPPPGPVPPATAIPTDGFSLERALAHVKEVAQRPHPTGSPENARVRDYIRAELESLGLSASVQEGTVTLPARPGRDPISAHVENVLSRLPGTAPSRPVVLLAHYDSAPRAPGAADDASGVAVLLEIARVLRTAPRPRNDVIFLFTDSEERFLLGATLFAREHPWDGQGPVALNLDCGPNGGRVSLSLVTDGNEWLLHELRASAPHVFASSVASRQFLRRLRMAYDLAPLADAGVSGLTLGFQDHPSFRHAPQDDVARLDRASLQQIGHIAVAVARRLADSELGTKRSGDAVYFWTRVTGLVVYPVTWAFPLALLAFAGWSAAAWAGWRRRSCGLWVAVPLGLIAVVQLLLASQLPGASYLLTWPLVAAVISFAVLVTSPSRLRAGVRVGLLMLCPALVLFLLAPLVPLAFTLIPARDIWWLAAGAGGTCSLIVISVLPQLVLLLRSSTPRQARQSALGGPVDQLARG